MLADGVPTVVVPVFLARGYHVIHDGTGVSPGARAGRADTAPGTEPRSCGRSQRSATPGRWGVRGRCGGAGGGREQDASSQTETWTWRTLTRLMGVRCTRFASRRRPPSPGPCRRGRTAIAGSPYNTLLAPGFFANRIADAGGDITSDPLGAHPEIIDLLVRRYHEYAPRLGG